MNVNPNFQSRIIQIPKLLGGGRLVLARELEGSADMFPGGIQFGSNLKADLFHRGKWQGQRDLGSGSVTNAGVTALAYDAQWAKTNGPNNLFRNLKYHGSGTNATAAAATDIKLGAEITGIAVDLVSGTQILVSAANVQQYQSVATISYDAGGPYTVTEWGLFANHGEGAPAVGAFSSSSGSPFTTGSSTSGTVTGTPYTGSGATDMDQSQLFVERTSGTNLSYGLVTSNTTGVLTVPAWYLVSTGASGQNPANTETFVLRPVLWDRKQFTGIGVSNGDSIQFTYTLTINSGG